MTEEEQIALRVKLGVVFRPGTPVDRLTLFRGRKSEINTVIDTVMQAGRHVIMFGEAGVGKTSLAKVIAEYLSNAGVQILSSGTINCDRTDNFDLLWRKIFRELTLVMRRRRVGFLQDMFDERRSLNSMLPDDQDVSPDDIRYVLGQIAGSVVIIIDEFDKLPDRDTTVLIADTIKNLSDHTLDTTLIIVGVADDVNELVEGHTSIDRVMVQVRMERMSKPSLRQIINEGLIYAGMTIDEEAQERIVHLSHGLPHYTHLLGLTAAINATENGRTNLSLEDVTAATVGAVQHSHSILTAYDKATTSPQKQSLYAQVLLACALTKPDALGYFSAADVVQPLSVIMEKPYGIPSFARHLNEFCGEKRGYILQKKGEPRRYRYRFKNPLMQPFVLIHGLANAFMPEELLWVASR